MNDKKKIEKSLKIRSTAFFVAAAVFFSAFFIDLFRIQVVNAAEYSTQKVTLRSVNTTRRHAARFSTATVCRWL